MKRMSFALLLARKAHQTFNCRLMSLLLCLTLEISPAGAVYALNLAPGQISIQDGKLSVQINAAPLWQVMVEVSRVSGARVRWLNGQAEETPVSVEFAALPTPEALRRILGERSFLLFYTPTKQGAKLTEIWIASGTVSGQSGSFPLSAPQPRMPRSTGVSTTQSEEAADRQAELDAMPVETLMQTAVSSAELSLRVEAIAQLGGRAQQDPKVEGLLSHLAAHDSNPQVRASAAEVLAGMEKD